MSDRKYRQRGYQDDGRERGPRPPQAGPRPEREPGAPAGAQIKLNTGLVNDVRPDVCVDTSGRIITVWTSVDQFVPFQPSKNGVSMRRLMPTGAPIAPEEVRRVVSHPHANAQCQVYLRTNLPGADVAAANSTADAVRLVSASDEPWAAIGTLRAADLYGCEVIAADIVEYNPRCDISNLTATVAAKLLKEIAGIMVKPG